MYSAKRFAPLVAGLMFAISMMAGAVPGAVAGGLGTGPGGAVLPQEQTLIDIVRRIAPAVVAVKTYDKKGEESGVGSG